MNASRAGATISVSIDIPCVSTLEQLCCRCRVCLWLKSGQGFLSVSADSGSQHQPSALLFVTWGLITCRRADCQASAAVWKPGAPQIRAEGCVSRTACDPWRSLGRQEGKGLCFGGGGVRRGSLWWWGMQGGGGVDEISGCTEVSFQPTRLR